PYWAFASVEIAASTPHLPRSRVLRRKWAVKITAHFLETRGKGEVGADLDGQEVAGAGVGAGVTQLGHGTRLDLADALAGEIEVLADLFEGAGLAAVEAETEAENLPLTFVEGTEQASDLVGQQRG